MNVTPVNDAPVFTSHNGVNDTIVSVDENTTAVTTVAATDLDGPTLTFSLSGEDSAFFQIDSSGALSFRDPQDYEAPADDGAGNTYQVTVRVSDGIDSDLQSFVVTLHDVDDATGGGGPKDGFGARGFGGGGGFDDLPWWNRPTGGGSDGAPTKPFPWADRGVVRRTLPAASAPTCCGARVSTPATARRDCGCSPDEPLGRPSAAQERHPRSRLLPACRRGRPEAGPRLMRATVAATTSPSPARGRSGGRAA